MGIAEIFAFIRALPEMVKALDRMVSALQQLRQDKIDEALDEIKGEVAIQVQLLTTAKNDEERKAALLALARATAK